MMSTRNPTGTGPGQDGSNAAGSSSGSPEVGRLAGRPGWTPPSGPPNPGAPLLPTIPTYGLPDSGVAGSLVLGSALPPDAGWPNPRAMMFNRLLGERIVMLSSELTDENAAEICGALLVLAKESGRDIRLYINSPGGSVTAGMAVLDTMTHVDCDVATVAMGMAGSISQVLLSAGTRGKRYALPHARVLMHQPTGEMTGSASDVRIAAEQVQALKRQLAELNAEHTGQSVEQIEADSDRDRWFNATQAREYGLIDHVLTRVELDSLS